LQQLIQLYEISFLKVSNYVANKRDKRSALKDDDTGKKQLDLVTNPSIGEFSLGAYTMTSRSVSGSNLFDFESKRSRAGIESLNAESLNIQVNSELAFSTKNTSVSNLAIAGDSINSGKEAQSMMSERSVNPSVTALAGSIR
jgi:hypothetical protein